MALKTFRDERGALSVMEREPFEIRRAFWIYDAKMPRGQHSHRAGEQLIVAVHGSFTVYVSLDGRQYWWKLDEPQLGVYLPPGAWIELSGWSEDAVALVLCSNHYTEEDIERGNEMSKELEVAGCES
jgi:hypothetical protein